MACQASLPPKYEVACRNHRYSPLLNLRIGSPSSICINSTPYPPNFISLFLKSSMAASSSSSSSSDSSSAFDDCSFSVIKNSRSNRRIESHAMSTTLGDASPKISTNLEAEPDHLLVLVHGIMGSPSDWLYCEAELKRRLGKSYMIYASSSNTFTKTFAGVDGAGKRLADEVLEVVKKNESLKKISFLSHSLGGLFSRYAIAVLYSADEVGDDDPSKADQSADRDTIAGLEAISFVTLATPHLGVRGRKQLPFLFGVSILEKLAPPLAPFLVGQTGSQLFLTDGNPENPPLLLRMASDCEDMKFLSALGAFKSRVLYSNTSYDHMVGWRTSSIRRESELPKPSLQSLEGYAHVVNVEDCPPISSTGPNFSSQAVEAKEAAQSAPCTENTVEYYELMEEEMIRGLQRLRWKKVDVSFHSATWPFFAHNSIQVKNERLHNAGAGVVSHVADSLKLQETSSLF